MKKKKFIFSEFFYTRQELEVCGSMEYRIAPVYTEPREYGSIENLKPAFDLSYTMDDFEILKRLGGEDAVRKNAVTMDQIELIIDAMWNGSTELVDIFPNIFFVIGENDELFALKVEEINGDYLSLVDFSLGEGGTWPRFTRVFHNEK